MEMIMSTLSDSEIEQRVLRELIMNDAITSREICVVCRHSVVTLRGTVHSFENKSAATQATKIVNGVVGVVNQIRVERRQVEPTAFDRPPSNIGADSKFLVESSMHSAPKARDVKAWANGPG